MRHDSPRWEEINPSEFAHEQEGLRHLASYLPDTDPYHVWANVEFVGTDGSINEVDALVLTPSGLYVLELKHWLGEVAGGGTQWTRRIPNGRLMPEDNPYILANRKAKRLAGLIRHYARQQGRADQTPYVGAAVFLHAVAMRANLDEIGRQHIYGLDRHPSGLPSLKNFLTERPRNPDHLVDPERARVIIDLVRGAKIRPSVADRKVGQLLLFPKPFAEGIGWQDFLAGHALDTMLVRRVRFYLTSRATDEEIPVIRRGAEREFRLLQGIHHPGIARATDLAEHPLGTAVVFDHDKSSVRFDQWLAERNKNLRLAQRLQLVQDLAEIIDYAHSRRLAHRALHPKAVFVSEPDSARRSLVITDWQTGGRIAGATQVTRLSSSTDGAGLELFFDDEVRRYQAPEAAISSAVPGNKLDVFSLGAIAYRIFADAEPAATAEDLVTAVRDRGLDLAAAADGIPETMRQLVYDATHGDPSKRLADVGAFLTRLEQVWEEITRPEPEPVVNPHTAHKGDVLEGGLEVVRRLGSGATALALLVKEPTADGRELVLKVARDEGHSERLLAEAATLSNLKHWQVASLIKTVTVGGYTALLMESAGPRTLAQELEGHRRLALDLLDRYGRDLLDIVVFLEGQGIWHRDIKPANLAARPRPKDKQPHLCIFDFSLSNAPADQLSAGTPPYLDPFLGPPRRMRYDAAAERFAAAVTLYEMATGQLPRWGDNANPAVIADEVTLEPATFDPAVADRLVEFFAKALARDAARRFDTAEEMSDAWRMIFVEVPKSEPGPVRLGPSPTPLTPDSLLDTVGLTARARSALERLGVHTVGELLAYEPSALTRAQGVPDATRKEILAQVRVLQGQLAVPAETVEEQPSTAQGVEAVSATLLPKATTRNAKEIRILEVLLGQAPTGDGTFLRWPAQAEAARATEQSQPQISVLLRKYAKVWLENQHLKQVRDEIVALLDARGGVMSAEEVAEAFIATRGSFTSGTKRLAQAIGLVRAAVEAELSRGGDARLDQYRFRSSGGILVGREPDDPSATIHAADLLAYAVQLGKCAAELAGRDPLPTRQRAIEELRAVALPDGAEPIAEHRVLPLAAAASNGVADVNTQGQLYPIGMSAERALRLAAASLVGQTLGHERLQERVRARFPRAQALPRRVSDETLNRCGVPLVWDSVREVYTPPTALNTTSSTRTGTVLAPLTGPSDDAQVDVKLAAALQRHAFVALLTSMRLLMPARRALLTRLQLTELNVTAVLLEQLRKLNFGWEAVVAADTGDPADVEFRTLTDLVTHHVAPEIERALAAPVPLLITEAAPLARYGQTRLLQELADLSRTRPAARLLLVPARRAEPAMLDNTQLPLTAPASQSLWLPESWIAPTVERTATR